jgi:hypothetical protein
VTHLLNPRSGTMTAMCGRAIAPMHDISIDYDRTDCAACIEAYGNWLADQICGVQPALFDGERSE